ncbi:hypothetical protein [Pseudomonas ovata]|uniref:hypothetical protein n=1 Tax=Pseudomonas ovata TaxID=1839709 RepID=UPI000D69D67A|nr:hypothetical protein [Pseudomonas ovata]
MSLESGIAELTSAANSLIAYFNSRKASIDAAVTEALLAIPNNKKVYYVDNVAGSDANNGKLATPFKTIDKAVASTPYGGSCQAVLLSDYIFDTDTSLDGISLFITSSVPGTKRKLMVRNYFNSTSNTNWMAALLMLAGSAVTFKDVSLNFPTVTGLTNPPLGGPNTFFRGSVSGQSPLVQVKLLDCEIVDASGATALLAYSPTSALLLEVYNTTFPSGFAGRYVFGLAAGAQSNAQSNVLTNLTTF